MKHPQYALAALGCFALALPAHAEDDAPQSWAVHGQITNITQANTRFTSPYGSTNSFRADSPAEETTDATLFLGVRPWTGGELWVNGEVDQGRGLDNTLGIAGFPSGGAYKIGANTAYLRLPRAFLRQIVPLGGELQKVEGDANQLAGSRTADNLTITAGKFAVTDVFDNNRYAHDPRADFLNWAVIDAGAYDYAADAWGYTFGLTVEWTQHWWTLRAGYFELSQVPNGKAANFDFRENSPMFEGEARYALAGRPGAIRLLGFVNRADMGSYRDALTLAQATHSTPDVAQVRRFSTRSGIVINAEQALTDSIGLFARASQNGGDKETYNFTDINRSASTGVSVKGTGWGRENDTLGAAMVVNALSNDAKDYLAAGGMGVLVGDGKLNYAPEKILEAYYALGLGAHLAVSFDYQHVNNPGYNHDRGPVSVYGLRLHGQF